MSPSNVSTVTTAQAKFANCDFHTKRQIWYEILSHPNTNNALRETKKYCLSTLEQPIKCRIRCGYLTACYVHINTWAALRGLFQSTILSPTLFKISQSRKYGLFHLSSILSIKTMHHPRVVLSHIFSCRHADHRGYSSHQDCTYFLFILRGTSDS